MKPIIGIVLRDGESESKLKIRYLYNDIISAIYKSGGIPIGIDYHYIYDYLMICRGFLLPGGDDFTDEELLAVREIIKSDRPLLGICLGMQEIGTLYDGKIIDIINHQISDMHEVTIKDHTLLSKILGCKKTLVNSRHKSAIINPSLTISAYSNDHVIEAVEDDNKKFLLGVEWHPENMYDQDLNARKIFDYFIKMCDDK